MTFDRAKCAIVAIAVLWTGFSAAFGQAQETGTGRDDDWIAEIVVTARGREETLQSVPDTITVFTAEDITDRRIKTVDDLTRLTPGVFIVNDQDPGTNLITIRGVSSNRQQAASVAYVIDGVYLADTELFTRRYFDIERIEVLKGPQGALYGRSAIGGVIQVSTAEPTETFAGRVEAGYGNGNSVTVDAAFGGPLAGDDLLFRAAVAYKDSDGFIRNSFLDRKVDGFESLNGRVKLRARPARWLTADLAIAAMDEEAGAAFISSGNVTGQNGGRLAGDALTDPFGDFEGRADRDWFGTSLRLSAALPGGTELTAITSYDDYDKFFVEELDFRNDTPVTLFGAPLFPDGIQPIRQPIAVEAASQEIRLASDGDQRFRWIAGGLYQAKDRRRTDDFGPLLFGAEAPVFGLDVDQFAVFGQVAFDITRSLELAAALRYDRDERRETVTGRSSGAVLSDQQTVFDDVQPKASLAWSVTDDHMLYATFAEGFKPGGFNPPPGPQSIHELVFRQEETRAWELGWKTLWLDGRLLFNGALFLTDYRDLQTTIFLNGQNVVLNVDAVDIKGVEAEARLNAGAGLSLEAAIAYTDAEISRLLVPDPLTGTGRLDFSGNQVPHSPRWTVNASAVYDRPLGDGALRARLDLLGVGRVNFEVDNVLFAPSRWVLDAQIGYRWGGYDLALWGRNITDKRWAVSAFGQGLIPLLAGLGPGGPFDSFTINRGAEFGVRAGAAF